MEDYDDLFTNELSSEELDKQVYILVKEEFNSLR